MNEAATVQHAQGAAGSGDFLVPGRNCWRIERAERFGVAVDAEDFFFAARRAMAGARHSIRLLAWDIDSRLKLVPEGANDGLPEELGKFFAELVRRNHDLHVDLLCWDYAAIYWMEREWLPRLRFKPLSADPAIRHLRMELDGRHPSGASHHQKILVIDDELAFLGGLDMTTARWDRPSHSAQDPLRVGTDGKPTSPFHDVQAVVQGPVARALAEQCALRWRMLGKEPIPVRPASSDDAASPREPSPVEWPPNIEILFEDVDVGISRTHPKMEGQAAVHEVMSLHLDAIASASQSMFFENQYMTSSAIGQAFAKRLKEEQGPELVVLSRHVESGWLEQASMGVLRSRMHRAIVEADIHRRYRLIAPCLPELKEGCLNVHSKVFTIDNRLMSIGSANLSNRSMTLDTECVLTIDSHGDPAIEAGIASFRARLLAEHLDVTPTRVREVERGCQGSLLKTIRTLRRRGCRTLDRIDTRVAEELDEIVPASAVIDPQQGLDAEFIARTLIPHGARRHFLSRHRIVLAVILAVALLTALWQLTPLKDWISVERVSALMELLRDSPFTLVWMLLLFLIGCVVMIPVTLLIAVTGLVFGPLQGMMYALAGSLAGASSTYLVGKWAGKEALRRHAGPRLSALSRALARRGILSLAIIRWIPLAPFAVVNMVAGASHIRFRDYIIGTALGMTPGIVLTTSLAGTAIETFRKPTPTSIAIVAGIIVAMIALGWTMQRWFGRESAAIESAAGEHASGERASAEHASAEPASMANNRAGAAGAAHP